MEQQEMQEERRARNFVWAAAEQYGLEPLFLAYAPDGTADMYLNIIIGLSYKWYDAQKLETFFHMLGGRQEKLYQGMLWIGLEQALYEKRTGASAGTYGSSPGICTGKSGEVSFV